MDGLLEGLYIQAEIDLARRDVLANVGKLAVWILSRKMRKDKILS